MRKPGAYILQAYSEKEFRDFVRRLLPSPTLNHPNLLFIQGETSIGIDAIRQIRQFLATKSWQPGYRVVAIADGNRLTLPAQNAFLKTLEEPGENVFIVIRLPDKNLYHLLPTVRSRCQILTSKKEKSLPATGRWAQFLAADPRRKLKLWRDWQKEMSPEQLLNQFINESRQEMTPKTGSALLNLRQQILLLLEAKKMLAANLKPEEVFDWLVINL